MSRKPQKYLVSASRYENGQFLLSLNDEVHRLDSIPADSGSSYIKFEVSGARTRPVVERPSYRFPVVFREGKQSMTRIILFVFFISLQLVSVAWSQDYKTAYADYERGDFTAAFKTWRTLALKGDVDSQFNLGVMYEAGQGVPQDYARAFAWYRLAANRGQAEAQDSLGSMYAEGLGVPRDEGKALMWYRKAAKQGHLLARKKLGMVSSQKSEISAAGPPAVTNADFRVQLGSFKSKPRAEKEASLIAQAYEGMHGKLEFATVAVNLGERGMFYRVRSGPLKDRAAAISMCREFEVLGRGCFVIEP
jgi:hypothetical protein